MRLGPWTLEREVGRGGMAVVYAARDADGRRAAVKLLEGGDQERLLRFLREAAALERLDHPAIVKSLGAGSEGARAWLAMELLGESLAARLLTRGPFHPREAGRIAAQVARALEHAHARGVLHRDVKPANILLRRSDGAPVLTDFGLARAIVEEGRGLTRTGTILGSPGFLAPEQADARKATQGSATDVHGLGATLYALLTGRPPFEGPTPLDTLLSVIQHPAPALGPPTDPALAAIVASCLEKDPARRPAEAGELAAALEAWLGTEDDPAPRRGSRALLVAAGAVVAAGVAVMAARPSSTPPDTDPGAVDAPSPPPPLPAAGDDLERRLWAAPLDRGAWVALIAARRARGDLRPAARLLAAIPALGDWMRDDPQVAAEVDALRTALYQRARARLPDLLPALHDLDLLLDRTRSADAYFLRADLLLAVGDPAGAVHDLGECIRDLPGHLDAQSLRLLTLVVHGEPGQATLEAERLAAASSTDPELQARCAGAILQLGELERGLALLGPAPTNPWGLIYRAHALAALGRFDEAEEALAAARTRATLPLGSDLDDVARRLSDVREAPLPGGPDGAPALLYRVQAAWERGATTVVSQLLPRLLERAPDWPAAHLLAAELSLEQGRPTEALDHMDRAAGRGLAELRARALAELGREDEARQTLASSPGEAPRGRGLALIALGDLDAARAVLEAACKSGHDVRAFLALSAARRRLGDLPGALQAIADARRQPAWPHLVAREVEALADSVEAMPDGVPRLEALALLRGASPDPWETLAVARGKAGDMEGGACAAERAMLLAKGDPRPELRNAHANMIVMADPLVILLELERDRREGKDNATIEGGRARALLQLGWLEEALQVLEAGARRFAAEDREWPVQVERVRALLADPEAAAAQRRRLLPPGREAR